MGFELVIYSEQTWHSLSCDGCKIGFTDDEGDELFPDTLIIQDEAGMAGWKIEITGDVNCPKCKID